MKIHFDNVNLKSYSGPNSFAARLANEFQQQGHDVLRSSSDADVSLVFIERSGFPLAKRYVHRLDGIWFKPSEFYNASNVNIRNTYTNANKVIFQSQFDKTMVEKHFGKHQNTTVIKNGVKFQEYSISNDVNNTLSGLRHKYAKIFVSSANWHSQKRLNENIRLFQHIRRVIEPNSTLLVLGTNAIVSQDTNIENVFFTDSLSHEVCFAIYDIADWMIHLAWLDHCPNVVVEALSRNLPVICSEDGGTKELVQNYGLILKEQTEYKFELTDYDFPPTIDVSQVTNLPHKNILGGAPNVDIFNIAKLYLETFESIL